MTNDLSKEEVKLANAILTFLGKCEVYSDFSYSAKWVADGLNTRVKGGTYKGTKERFDEAEMTFLGMERKLESDPDAFTDEMQKTVRDKYHRYQAQHKAEQGLMKVFRAVQECVDTGETVESLAKVA
jgi:hypothetical protein